MSEPIKLKVSKNPPAEFVSHGNFRAELKPTATVETTSRQFADFLISNYGLTEMKPETKTDVEAAEKSNPLAANYPPDFPGRDHLIAARIPFASARGIMPEQLVKIPGIGAATADQIANYQPKSLVETMPQATDETGQTAASADSTATTAAANTVAVASSPAAPDSNSTGGVN